MTELEQAQVPEVDSTKSLLEENILSADYSEIIDETIKSSGYIANRLELMLKITETGDGAAIYGSSLSIGAFIPPSAKIYSESLLLSKPYYLDDESIYYSLQEALSLVKQKFDQNSEVTPEVKAFNIAFYAVHYLQFKYFENKVGGNPKKRTDMLADIIDLAEIDFNNDQSDTEEQMLSIKELKSSALCMERAVVCHNLFVYLGIDSTLRTGKLVSDETEEYHAWVEIKKADGTIFIFDPQNPHIVLNENGQLIEVKPLVFKLREGEAASTKWKKTNQAGELLDWHELCYKN